MSQKNTHYRSKSTLLLTLLTAAGLGVTVKAEETVTSSSVTSAQTSLSQTSVSEATSSAATSAETTAAADTYVATDSAGLESAPATAAASLTETNTNQVQTPVEGQTLDVRILGTTDLHTNLVNYDYYQDKASEKIGLAKTAILISQAKAENSNVILVDNGDTIQGTPLGTYKAIVDPVDVGEKHPMYATLEALGFDAVTLGNHEFNYGLDYLKKVLANNQLPAVNANVLDTQSGTFLFDPYKIITKTFTDPKGQALSLNIGITGIVPPQILNWDKANLEGKVTVLDSVQAVEAMVPVMKAAGADIILVLSHSGIGDDQYDVGEENVGYQIAGIDGVDAVVTGHSHAEFPSGNGTGFYEKYRDVDGVNGTITGTPVVMAGKYGDHLGIIDLGLIYQDGKWQVASSHAEIRKVDDKSTVADPTVLAIAKEAHEGTIQYVRQQVGTTTAPINSYFALVKDDPSIQIVNNAQIWYAQQELAGTPEASLPILSAAAPFKAGTRGDATAYTDIPAGPIAIKNVADLYLYDNVTAILKVTGADLREWLEMSAGQFNQVDPTVTDPQDIINTNYRTYNFDVIDGLTYQYDITQPNKYDINGNTLNPAASRLRNLSYNGSPVTDDQEFIVVTNNYRANGNFPGVRNATLNQLLNLENRQVIINYILNENVINPSADHNWTFTNSIAGLDLRFLTADKAQNLIVNDPSITYLGTASSDGFGVFRFNYVELADQTSQEAGQAQGSRGVLTAQQRAVIHQLATRAYQETKKARLAQRKKTEPSLLSVQAQLPQTGTTDSILLSLIGIGLISLLPFLKAKKR